MAQAKENGIVDMSLEDNAYLVTGNIKHFPKKPFVVTPRKLLDILNESN